MSLLGYPELAVGDARKAKLLCDSHARHPEGYKTFTLGHGMGFKVLIEPWNANHVSLVAGWEYTTAVNLKKAIGGQQETLRELSEDATNLFAANLCLSPDYLEGKYLPRQYPWQASRHQTRSDALLGDINSELATNPAVSSEVGPVCHLEPDAFKTCQRDLLGVFSLRDVKEGVTILIDTTRTWGCNGRSDDTDDLRSGFSHCGDALHPNSPSDRVCDDLRWVRERIPTKAADALVLCRFLLRTISDGAPHPLDHSYMARLTPTCRDKARGFVLEDDIDIPNTMLLNMGVDIFADLRYDTWVLFTMKARIENNSWSDPMVTSVNPLFSLFNHSCEPNVEWTGQEDHRTVIMKASQDVKKGEQFFVAYDGYISSLPLVERRKRLARWLNGPCQCSRCAREEREEMSAEHRAAEIRAGLPNWDPTPPPLLPEMKYSKIGGYEYDYRPAR